MHIDCSSLSLWFFLWWFWLTFNKTAPIHYFNKLEYFIRPIKKTFFVNCWPSGKYVYLLYMYSILGVGSFCFNYCLNSAWHRGDQFVALLKWYGSPCFFDSGLQLICFLVSCFSFSSWQYPIDSIWDSGLVSLLASQAHQHHGHLTNFWHIWQYRQVPNPAGKWNQHL